jgi:glycosyltransferase involved in cell wall biosynthesis
VDGKNFVFISIGSLIPVKNHELLIEAAKILKSLNLKFTILILGSGYLESLLKEKVCDYKLENDVKFIGFTENPYKFIREANVFVMTSKSEALPTAMLEAMVLGKPVITTNVTGSREIVGMGIFGLLTDENPDSLSKAMRDFIENDDLYYHYKEKALLRATEFTDERFLVSFNNLLYNANSPN